MIEMMQKFSDAPLTRCPQCSGKVSKIISNCTFHLKGSGWYVTDYKKNGATSKDKTPEVKKTDPPKIEATPKAAEKKD
jgi:putative FmdB family regulatory protein